MQLISMQVADEKKISLALSRFMEGISDFRGFWTDHLEPALIEIFDEQFRTEGGRGSSGKWKDLTDAYRLWKAKRYPGAPILVRTGDMKKYFTDGGTMVSQKYPNEYILWGPTIALYHQTGTKKMAARPIVDLTRADKIEKIGKALHTWCYREASKVISDYHGKDILGIYQGRARWSETA